MESLLLGEGRNEMQRGWLQAFLAVGLSIAVVGIFTLPTSAASVKRISREELKSILNNPDVIILDVDREGNWKDRDRKILGAVRENPKDIETWMDKYARDKPIVLY